MPAANKDQDYYQVKEQRPPQAQANQRV